ncbi:glycosyltransferase family 1 protein [Salinarimonas sp.]|uniref:glycosyltransferase family 4 protein n=1 Tax=Salinarimonas sp. TaxID=2766526 RepID=UPI0032D94666
MRLLVATDAWRPQINGVVRSLEYMAELAPEFGAEVSLVTPSDFRSVPMPTYPEIRLALARPRAIARRIEELAPTHIHIATEGPIGIGARKICLAHGFPYTTSYHTRFPEYVAARAPVPERWIYRAIRRFHNTGRGIMVATDSLEADLRQRGFANILRWGRGVDTELFRPRERRVVEAPGPIFLYVGRVAVEKNIGAFLALDLPGTKVVVGDGPARAELERKHSDAVFLGAKTGEALAEVYASADVFVFPSLTDTFGIVLLEALASGLPIAAYPVTGPLDVVGDSGCGVLDQDLRAAALAALEIPRDRCRAYGETFTWRESARQFFGNIRKAAGNEPVVDVSRL